MNLFQHAATAQAAETADTAQRSSVWQTVLAAGILLFGLSACATGNHPRDPLEGYNRAMFSFNDAVDRVALKPAATVYQKITPGFVQTGVGNFFGNIGDLWTALNNLLQGKVADAATDFTRVAVNSTFGFAGLLDIASEAGLPKHKEDFGQTLGKWGIKAGPYIVLPLLGSSTLRDTLALPLDVKGDAWAYKEPEAVRYAGAALRILDQRAALLDAGNLLDDAALDRYEFVRDGFLQRRESKVYDGDAPGGDKNSGKGSSAAKISDNTSAPKTAELALSEMPAMPPSDSKAEVADTAMEEQDPAFPPVAVALGKEVVAAPDQDNDPAELLAVGQQDKDDADVAAVSSMPNQPAPVQPAPVQPAPVAVLLPQQDVAPLAASKRGVAVLANAAQVAPAQTAAK